MRMTNLSKVQYRPNFQPRMTWRRKVTLNLLGLVAWVFIVILGFGVVGLYDFIVSITWREYYEAGLRILG